MGSAFSLAIEPEDQRKQQLKDMVMGINVTQNVFNQIESEIRWTEKYYLGFCYKVWKVACQYKFMVSKRVNPEPNSADVICNLTDIENQVIIGFKNGDCEMIDPLVILFNILGKPEYKRLLTEGMSNDTAPLLFREQVQCKMIPV